jgi:ATP-dependent Lon protease
MRFPHYQVIPKKEIDLKQVKQALDETHHGLKETKNSVMEYLALKKSSKIILLVGPPGTGKTSIAESIAKVLGMKFEKISLAGAHDELIIRGSSITYVGSNPGAIAQAMQRMNSEENKYFSALILLDEIDKVNKGGNGDPAAAVSEALDPAQNSKFNERYLGELDLSKVFFICTANSLDTIPDYLLSRLDIIFVDPYSVEEKKIIARKLIKKKVENNKKNLSFTSGALEMIINSYAFPEGGVRNLERAIEKVFAQVILEESEKGGAVNEITPTNLYKYLGYPLYNLTAIGDKPRIGEVNGLSVSNKGGEVLKIQVSTWKGKGNLILTGNLKKVIKESAEVALGYIKSNSQELGINLDKLAETDIQLHLPEGAIPKDGPSAGVGFFIALVSALTKQPISHKIAMTGEITLTGEIKPVGGIKEKVLAAIQAGVDQVFIPKGNENDIKEVIKGNPEISIKVTLVDNAMEVLKEVPNNRL